MKTPTPNYINHIVFVLDASGSMLRVADDVIKVFDAQVAHLAQRSRELDQETRVTVYDFSYRSRIRCLFYDKDVLRLPSLNGLYSVDGQTALVDATIKALEDLAKTPELYGDHAFLVYVLTDGEENDSLHRPSELKTHIAGLKDNWTVACFVPNVLGRHEAMMFGFPSANIAVWDATSAKGVEEAGRVVREATESFMNARSVGVRSMKSIFDMNLDKLSSSKMSGALDKLHPGRYRMFDVKRESVIAPFIERMTGCQYVSGTAYYQLMKKESIQPQKQIAILDKRDHAVYTGANARKMLGLPDLEVRVNPQGNPNFDVFVQSTSVNRKLLAGTKVLLLS